MYLERENHLITPNTFKCLHLKNYKGGDKEVTRVKEEGNVMRKKGEEWWKVELRKSQVNL